MKKIKLGIIGTGLASKNLHLPALYKLSDKFEITAVCNHTEKKGKDFSALVGNVPVYTDYKKMLKEADIDAVDIALPIELNHEVTMASFKAGKHVFLEKPLAASIKEGKQLLEAEKKYNVTALLAENFRYKQVFRSAKELIKKGKIGKVFAFNWNLYYNVTKKNEYAQTKWRQENKYPGGFVLDAGVHNIAAVRYLFGEIDNGTSYIKSINSKIGEYDTMSFSFEMLTGVNGVYNIYFSVKGHWEDQLLIFGTKGTIELCTNKITVKKEDMPDEVFEYNESFGYYEEFTDFYNAITKKKKPFSTFNEGYIDMVVVIDAINYGIANSKGFIP
jgi:predicted dehydrogenase